MQIGPRIIERMKKSATELIDTNASKINIAFLKSDDEKLTVSLSFSIGVSKKAGLDVDTTIGFVVDRAKETIRATVIENQMDLPLESGITIQLGADPKVYKLKGE